MAKQTYTYGFNCVSAPNDKCSLDELMSLVDRMREISVSTFKRALGKELVDEIRAQFGMAPASSNDGITLEGDYHLRFGSVRHRGKTSYVMIHSAIEYVYIPQS